MKYRRKPEFIDAHRWNPNDRPSAVPEWINEAIIRQGNSWLIGGKWLTEGEWICRNAANVIFVLSDAKFKESFEEATA